MNPDRVTKAEKREFVRRCKELARRHGERTKYYPARWQYQILDLQIRWQPDEDYLHVRLKLPNRKPVNESWSMVVQERRSNSEWGYVHRVHDHLELLRRVMVLDDLADVRSVYMMIVVRALFPKPM